MAFLDDLPVHLRKMYDEGLDEVLIFAIIFILALFFGNDSDLGGVPCTLPLVIIAVFLLLFLFVYRRTDEPAGL
ncbi:MAG: hypothetical protein ACOX4M_03220 [Acetivibrionales bacterium]|jgi:hypothetical protein